MELTTKVLVQGTLINQSPMLVGTGEGEWVDKEVVRDPDNVPYIPATALGGVLRHEYERVFADDGQVASYFFGTGASGADVGDQSHCAIEDARPLDPDRVSVTIRSGIRIDPQNGTTKHGAKYDYELVEPGCAFGLRCEVFLYDDGHEDQLVPFLQRMLWILQRGLRVGAKTQAGFGRLELSSCHFYRFDFPTDGIKWFDYLDWGFDVLSPYSLPRFEIEDNAEELVLTAEFSLQRALLIGSSPSDVRSPDKVHITSNGIHVLPATSLKGALRHQAERIIRTLAQSAVGQDVEAITVDLVAHLFGSSTEQTEQTEDAEEHRQRSRIRIEEVPITGERSKTQTRIRVDRFTGGAMNGSLFNEEPIFHQNENFTVTMQVSEPTAAEVGLLLLLLKDLWTGHVALGEGKAVGRGLLTGKCANITHRQQGQEYCLKIQGLPTGVLLVDNAERAQHYVDAFVARVKGGNMRHES